MNDTKRRAISRNLDNTLHTLYDITISIHDVRPYELPTILSVYVSIYTALQDLCLEDL
jgi:hypothetical protein